MITFKQLEQACDTLLGLRAKRYNSSLVTELTGILAQARDFDGTVPGAIRHLMQLGYIFGDSRVTNAIALNVKVRAIRRREMRKRVRRLRGIIGIAALLMLTACAKDKTAATPGRTCDDHQASAIFVEYPDGESRKSEVFKCDDGCIQYYYVNDDRVNFNSCEVNQ